MIERRMRICIAMGPWLPMPATRGGATNRIWTGLAQEFARAGHDVTVVCRSDPDQPHEELLDGVRYLRRGRARQSKYIALSLLKDLVYAASASSLLRQSDIVVLHDFWLPVFCRVSAPRAHTVLVLGRMPKGQLSLYRNVNTFVALSAASAESVFRQAPWAQERTVVIPNPIDTASFHAVGAEVPSKRKPSLLFVGRIHPEKGIDLLLSAFRCVNAKRPETELIIVGPATEDAGGGGARYEAKLREAAKGLPVRWMGPIYDVQELAQLYRSTPIFCYPSLAEGGETFGLAPLEAVACGAVPVVSELACFREHLEPERTGLVIDQRAPDAANRLAATLEGLLTNPSKLDQMAKEGALAAERFQYRVVTEQYLDLFSRRRKEQG